MKVTVVIPTYNERENLPILLAGIRRIEKPLDVIVVDDNSPDGTGDTADSLAACDGRMRVIHRPGKLGLGTAQIAGFEAALPAADAVVTMDADLSHDPAHIPALIDRVENGSDLAIGSRYISDGSVDFKMWRRVLSAGGNLFAAALLGLRTRDNTSGFRCYRRDALEKIIAEPFTADGYSFLMEILYRAKRAGLNLSEAPIHYADRRFGETKVSTAEIYHALGTVCRLRFRR